MNRAALRMAAGWALVVIGCGTPEPSGGVDVATPDDTAHSSDDTAHSSDDATQSSDDTPENSDDTAQNSDATVDAAPDTQEDADPHADAADAVETAGQDAADAATPGSDAAADAVTDADDAVQGSDAAAQPGSDTADAGLDGQTDSAANTETDAGASTDAGTQEDDGASQSDSDALADAGWDVQVDDGADAQSDAQPDATLDPDSVDPQADSAQNGADSAGQGSDAAAPSATDAGATDAESDTAAQGSDAAQEQGSDAAAVADALANDAASADDAPDADAGSDATSSVCDPLLCPDDGNPCTTAICTQGACSTQPAGGSCDDGNACTQADSCTDGNCQAGPPASCEDGNSCTLDSCNPLAGCEHDSGEGVCSDGDACTVGDKCSAGLCAAGAPKACDDGEPCTADACAQGSCQHVALPCERTPCDPSLFPCEEGVCDPDSHACVPCLTHGDCGPAAVCAAGACKAGLACGTDTACKATAQVCDTAAGVCVDCLGNSDCGAGFACERSRCVEAKPCDSSKVCPAVCDTGSGVCVDCLTDLDCAAAQYCDAQQRCVPDVCTTPQQCAFGARWTCAASGAAWSLDLCDDSNPCTTDACTPQSCTHVNLPDDTTCSDAEACKLADWCSSGTCVSEGGLSALFATIHTEKSPQGAPVDAEAVAVIDLGSAGYLMVGPYGANGAGLSGSWVRPVSRGGVVGAKQSAGVGRARDAARSTAGTLFVAGESNASPHLYTTTAGNQTLSGVGSAYGVAVLPAGGAVVVGQLAGDGLIWRVSEQGQTQWQLQPGGQGDDLLSDVVALADGSVVAVGHTTSGTERWGDVWAIRVSSDGSVVWQRSWPGALDESASAVAALPDGDLLIAIDRKPLNAAWLATGQTDSAALLARITAQGDWQWQKTLWDGVARDAVARLAPTADGGAVATGWSATTESNSQEGRIARVDPAGEVLWTWSGGSPRNDQLADVVSLSDGGVLAVGLRNLGISGNLGLRGPWLVRLDAFGNTSCAASGGCADPGAVAACDDANQCTYETCSAASGCGHTTAPDGAGCDDGQSCAAEVACSAGQCGSSGQPLNCDDQDACTLDGCVGSSCTHAAAFACGNDVCEPCEDPGSCPADCSDECGNGLCAGEETAAGCPADCAALAHHLMGTCVTPGGTAGCPTGSVCVAVSAAGGGPRCVQDQTLWLGQPALTANDFVQSAGYSTSQQTGLVWQQTPTTGVTRQDALTACTALTLGGWSDWRLPTLGEALSLRDIKTANAPSGTGLTWPSETTTNYWVASPAASGEVWYLRRGGDPRTVAVTPDTKYAVRCVRGGQEAPATPLERFAVSAASGHVLDRLTGLRWQRDVYPTNTFWSSSFEALCDANAAGLQGTGWSLPSMAAFQTLLAPTLAPATLAPLALSQTQGDFYPVDTGSASTVLWTGEITNGGVANIRCVR